MKLEQTQMLLRHFGTYAPFNQCSALSSCRNKDVSSRVHSLASIARPTYPLHSQIQSKDIYGQGVSKHSIAYTKTVERWDGLICHHGPGDSLSFVAFH